LWAKRINKTSPDNAKAFIALTAETKELTRTILHLMENFHLALVLFVPRKTQFYEVL
jgi:hypothetical protein